MPLRRYPIPSNVSTKDFGLAIRVLMAQKHFTIRQLAALSGLTISTIWRLRRMTSFQQCHPTTFRRLAATFGMSVDEFHELTVGPHRYLRAV
jgi:transcriptional regulator with XRE-family HTH domain